MLFSAAEVQAKPDTTFMHSEAGNFGIMRRLISCRMHAEACLPQAKRLAVPWAAWPCNCHKLYR